MSEIKEMSLSAVVENIPEVTAFVEQELEEHNCPPKTVMQIGIVIDELFCNISRYAYHPDIGDATIRVWVDDDARSVRLVFEDKGKPYNPLSKEDPDITLSAEEREIGGLGIFIVKKYMDDMEYEYKDGKNILKLSKNF